MTSIAVTHTSNHPSDLYVPPFAQLITCGLQHNVEASRRLLIAEDQIGNLSSAHQLLSEVRPNTESSARYSRDLSNALAQIHMQLEHALTVMLNDAGPSNSRMVREQLLLTAHEHMTGKPSLQTAKLVPSLSVPGANYTKTTINSMRGPIRLEEVISDIAYASAALDFYTRSVTQHTTVAPQLETAGPKDKAAVEIMGHFIKKALEELHAR